MNLQLFAEEELKVEEVPEVDPVETVVEGEESTEQTEEPVVEEVKETNDEVAALRSMVASLAEQITTFISAKPEEPVEEVFETEVEDKSVEQHEAVAPYEAALNTVIQEKLQNIPEGIAALMPDNLNAVDKLAWIDKAIKAVPVVEEPVKEEKTVIESIGKATPVPTETEQDIKKLSAFQKMSKAFEEQFAKK